MTIHRSDKSDGVSSFNKNVGVDLNTEIVLSGIFKTKSFRWKIFENKYISWKYYINVLF